MAKIRENIALNIRKYRKQRNLTQEALANRSGLHRTYIGSIERLERNITVDNLEKIALALRVRPKDLLDE